MERNHLSMRQIVSAVDAARAIPLCVSKKLTRDQLAAHLTEACGFPITFSNVALLRSCGVLPARKKASADRSAGA